MNNLKEVALLTVPLSEETVESYWNETNYSGTPEEFVKLLCASHERLRAELNGAEQLLSSFCDSTVDEEAGKSAVRSLLTTAKEAVSMLRSLNEHEKVCRELIAAKLDKDYDLAIALSNIMRRLDNAAEVVERSIEPTRKGDDFEEWLTETFYGRDTDLKMEAVSHAHYFNYEQAIRLATYIWECMENTPPPWWSKFADAEKAAKQVATALALTDTGSEEFKRAFPSKSLGAAMNPTESVPGWRVVEKIRRVLQGVDK